LNAAAPRTVHQFIRWAEQQLDAAGLHFGHGTERARDEAAWLVGSALDLEPGELAAHLRAPVTRAQGDKIHDLIATRVRTRKPAAYLLKEAWFAGRKFYVDERVLIPRSLTGEFILERFAPWLEPRQVRRALDLCTGSGCIAIALAHAFPAARVDATDISPDALAVARINVDRHKLAGRVRLLASDLFDALKGEHYDLIVTNPPYVAAAEMRELPEEYRHEPALALVSGKSGLDAIRRILAAAADHLTAHGVLVAEVGNSADALQRRFPRVPFTWLVTSGGDDSVFLLTADQLARHRPSLRAARARRARNRRSSAGRGARRAR
jgi:ribosomal protein L3 glutamine methyltransferase